MTALTAGAAPANFLLFDDFHGFRIDSLFGRAAGERSSFQGLRTHRAHPASQTSRVVADVVADPLDFDGAFEVEATADQRRVGLAVCLSVALASAASMVWLGVTLAG